MEFLNELEALLNAIADGNKNADEAFDNFANRFVDEFAYRSIDVRSWVEGRAEYLQLNIDVDFVMCEMESRIMLKK